MPVPPPVSARVRSPGFRLLPACLLVLAAVTAATAVRAQERAGVTFPVQPLTILPASGDALDFLVEIARTPAQRARGLMFRKTLADRAGMLFDHGPGLAPVVMWMRNTLIPLDMLFLGRDGRILRIHENAVPRSSRRISSVVPVRAVLELPGGSVSRLGIAAGDRVVHDIFAPDPKPPDPKPAGAGDRRDRD